MPNEPNLIALQYSGLTIALRAMLEASSPLEIANALASNREDAGALEVDAVAIDSGLQAVLAKLTDIDTAKD